MGKKPQEALAESGHPELAEFYALTEQFQTVVSEMVAAPAARIDELVEQARTVLAQRAGREIGDEELKEEVDYWVMVVCDPTEFDRRELEWPH